MTKKTTTISFKVSLETINQIEELCVMYGVDKSKIIRTLVASDYEKFIKFKKLVQKKQKNNGPLKLTDT
ncbi:MAG: hypothetical protein KKE44_12450 [Proteobacteria bacterium]|nr:hypothetical protein [Pseudomonadota bacterium]MBU1583537.1 hypothetical protein [Pseudomonadota bacterium]MBU2455056.1 hypothetical protein [Pseudomonadota bacterium]MBU2627866.1 hypothetical protein [Pseudomonadota bacterium]